MSRYVFHRIDIVDLSGKTDEELRGRANALVKRLQSRGYKGVSDQEIAANIQLALVEEIRRRVGGVVHG